MIDNKVENCKIGDLVYTTSNIYHQISIGKIVRETSTLWILENGTKINKQSGKVPCTNSWDATFYYKVTPDIIKEYNIQQLQKKVSKLSRIEGIITEENYSEIKELVDKLLAYINKKETK